MQKILVAAIVAVPLFFLGRSAWRKFRGGAVLFTSNEQRLDEALREPNISEENKAMRENDVITFESAAAVLRACGNDAANVIRTKHGWQPLSPGTESMPIFSLLAKAGFSYVEAMSGVLRANIIGDNQTGVIVMAAVRQGVPINDVIAFLASEHINPEVLDGELTRLSASERMRVDVLHRLFTHSY